MTDIKNNYLLALILSAFVAIGGLYLYINRCTDLQARQLSEHEAQIRVMQNDLRYIREAADETRTLLKEYKHANDTGSGRKQE